MRNYELVMVITPEADAEQATSTVENVSRFITEHGGTVSSQEQWGTKRLAYPIERFREANFVLTEFALEPTQTVELEASLKSSTDVLRHLLVKKATKAK